MKKNKFLALLCSAVLMVGCGAFVFAACDTDPEPEPDPEPENVLEAPTDFTFDTETGEFSFNAEDENAGYYFVRVFQVTNGVEASTYTVSSTRINGGSTGAKSGSVNVGGIGWGDYNVKLVTYTAAGTDYTAPDPVVLRARYGIGGVLERPEMQVISDGNTVEVILDLYSLNDYYLYQVLPSLNIKIYSDEALTTAVVDETYDLSSLADTLDNHPAGGIIWGYSNSALHKIYRGDVWMGYANNIWSFELDAGTYYATVQAISGSPDVFASSQVSETIEFTLTDSDPVGCESNENIPDSIVIQETSLWNDPSCMGMIVAMTNYDTSGRVDAASSQSTTSQIIS